MTGRLNSAFALLALLISAGCMGEPTREILLPAKLKGAKVTADGEDAIAVKQEIAVTIPLRAGTQLIRIEPAGRAPIVERVRIFVNDPKAERAGENVILAKVDQKMLSRVVIAFPEDPVNNLGHDFEPPASGEGVILLSSQTDTRVVIDGSSLDASLPSKSGMPYQSYVTRSTVVKLAPGKHRVEFLKPAFARCAVDVEVVKGEYELIGATLAKAVESAPAGGKS